MMPLRSARSLPSLRGTQVPAKDRQGEDEHSGSRCLLTLIFPVASLYLLMYPLLDLPL